MFTIPTLLQRRRIRIDGRIRRGFFFKFFSFIISHLFFIIVVFFVGGVVFVFVCFLDLHQFYQRTDPFKA